MNEPNAPGQVLPYLDLTVAELLEAFSDSTPVPGGGGAAVVAVVLSASLCAMTARLSSPLVPDASDIAAEALAIRATIAPLCEQDARTYLDVIAAQRRPASNDPDITSALSRATDVPMATAEAGARLACLAARLVLEGNPNLRGDAFVAAVLAGAGVEAATTLARINLAGLPHDARHPRARSLLEETTRWVDRARNATSGPS